IMDSSLSNKTDRLEQTQVEDLRSEFTSECSFLPDSQHSCLGEKQHLQVYLRIRPFTSEESKRGESQDCVTIEALDTVLLRPPSSPAVSARFSTDRALPQAGQRFRFSKVYGPETTQRELFDGTVKDLVKDALEGTSTLVFTYGVTNAGKTFTFLGPDADAGILPRSLDVIFNSMEGQVFCGMSIKPHRCREFTRLSREQQAEEELFKRNLFRQTVEVMSSIIFNRFRSSTSAAAEDGVKLKVEANTKFSVWVSFCEIYNENIHDLLEVTPSGAPRRTALRLSQDIKGNAFIKDLRWVQVDTAEEAYKVVKLGKKNQSFCSTRLNNLSSRSHSIFSIRILRIEDAEMPRVSTVSELCLCDLAGSERCAKTQNKGERLKEAGNINTSLLILGKFYASISFIDHFFLESKLTHYLQGFFCGRGKTCMIVNINQCASMYDETLSVLKFSAVAQKVYNTVYVSIVAHCLLHMLIVKTLPCKLLVTDRSQYLKNDFNHKSMLLEARIREETSQEFSQLFHEMQNDFTERLAREKDILEERAEKRMQICRNLINKMYTSGSSQDAQDMVTWICGSGVAQFTSSVSSFMRRNLICLQTQLETESSEVQEKSCQLKTLTQKLQTLKEELQATHVPSEGDREELKEELLELKTKLAEEKEQKEKAQSHMQELERELTQVREQLAQNQLVSEQISDQLNQTEASTKEEQERMLHKLTDELRAQFECQQQVSKEEVDQLRAKLQKQTEASENQIRHLNDKLQEQNLLCKQQHEDWTQKLSQERETSSKQLNDLTEKLSQKDQALDLLEANLKQKVSNLKTEEDLRRLNSDLQSEVAFLKVKLSNIEAKESSVDVEQMLKEKDEQMEEKLAELKKASEDREAELLKKVLEAEAEVASLQKGLQAAQEKREDEECQAVREARRKEVERRKELLAVAHEAIAQKDAELKKRGSTGFPSVLDSSEISTENGRSSRFPRPELEISFSPLQPNRMALRRQGEESAVTVKITRTARKRKSGEMEKVEAENRRNTRSKLTPKLTPQKEETDHTSLLCGQSSSPAGCHDSQSSVRSRKEGALQKIGDFLQSSPTLLGSKGQCGTIYTDKSDKSALFVKEKLNNKKSKDRVLPEISSPMEMPSHPVSFTHILFKRRFSVLLTKLFFIPLDKLQMCKCFCLDSWI
uniref:Kinesin family member 20Ba n=1 Tax=Oryzias latipes TaxID=8090 RepID=A0A3P9IH86_ORYLA